MASRNHTVGCCCVYTLTWEYISRSGKAYILGWIPVGSVGPMGKYVAGLSTEDGQEVTMVVVGCKARVFGCSNRGRR